MVSSVMAEFHRYPLRVQQSKLDGWWFIFIDECQVSALLVQITKTCLTGLKSWQEVCFSRVERPLVT
jgi:hypothetical protein